MAKRTHDMIECPEMEYFMNEEKSDVVFVIDGQRLPAQKQYLSIKNNVFKAMFSGEFKESKDKEVVIKDTIFEAFKTLIQFLYCDQMVLNDENDYQLIEEVYKLTDRYEMPRLMNKIIEYVKTKDVNSENMESISRIGAKYEIKEFIDIIDTYIERNLYIFAKKSEKELVEMSAATNNRLIKVLAKSYLSAREEVYHINKGRHCGIINTEWRQVTFCGETNRYQIDCTVCNRRIYSEYRPG